MMAEMSKFANHFIFVLSCKYTDKIKVYQKNI